MRFISLLLSSILLAVIPSCGSSSGNALLTRNAVNLLLTIDQLPAIGFVINTPAHSATIRELKQSNLHQAANLNDKILLSAAQVRYFRPVPNIALANGPIDITSTVEEFNNDNNAHNVFTSDVNIQDPQGISTGSLGDEAHAITNTATLPNEDVDLVQITLEWRVGNVVNIIIARGRNGATRIDDLVPLAKTQIRNEH